MKVQLAYFFLIALFFSCDQEPSDLYDPEIGIPKMKNFPGVLTSVCYTSDSGFVFCGRQANNSILKINQKDNQIWHKEYAIPFNSKLISIVNAENNNFLICGILSRNWTDFKNDILILKINSFGDTIFTKILRDSLDNYSIQLLKTNDNDYVLLGHSIKIYNNKESSNVFIYKINSSGQIIWFREFLFSNSEYPKHILQTSNGDLVITCNQFDKLGNKYLFMFRTNRNGELLWHKQQLSKSFLNGNMCIETPQGNLVVCGQAKEKLSVNEFDPGGQEIWNFTYGIHMETVSGNYLINDIDNGLLILGTSFNSITFKADILLLKMSNQGKLTWSRKISGSDSDFGKYLFKDINGDNIVLGNTYSPELSSAENNIFLFRTDINGLFK